MTPLVQRQLRHDVWATERLVVLAFLVHHAEHHSSQVATALSAQGLESPVLDVWAYGRTIGEVT